MISTSGLKKRVLTAVEFCAIALVLIVRVLEWMPLPAWPLLLGIAVCFNVHSRIEWSNAFQFKSSPKMIWVSILIGIGYQFFTIFVEGPFLGWLYGEPETPPEVDWLVGNVAGLIGFLVLIVIFSVGEELAFRGYLLERLQAWIGSPPVGVFAALLLSSTAFGFMHTWQNLSGVTGTVISGIVFGCVYLCADRDIRAPILTHLAVNVTAVILAFLGLFIS